MIVAVTAQRTMRRRRLTHLGRVGGEELAAGIVVDPAHLERQAAEAEQRGEYATAVRLRFRAGVVRLARRGLVDHADTSRTSAVRRAVPSDTMAQVATTFEAIAYGARPAGRDEAESSRHGWDAIRREVEHRG
jgi:hypothetical protein